MKKKITKIWGVGLTLVLVTTMVLWAAPVSAGTLSWSAETIPTTSGYRLAVGDAHNLDDIAVNGDIVYSVNTSAYMYRSSNGGETWSAVLIDDDLRGAKVAVAPDDENYIAVAGNFTGTTGYVYISDDAGANWDSLGPITLGASPSLNDLAVSALKSDQHYVSVAATGASAAQVWYYKVGAVGASWINAATKAGFEGDQAIAGAVEFSPNFGSDEVMVAVSANTGGTTADDGIIFQIFTFDQVKWNASAGFDLYPVTIVRDSTDANVNDLDSASISLSPDYLGSDDDMRLSFVGISTDGTETGDDADGIFRLDEDSVDALKEDKNIHSIAYDGTNLVAGRYDTTTVYRSADPLASSPTVSGSASLKSPGGANKAVVAWSGENVVAGTSGDESAFAVSENDGKTFNDISLIRTTLTVLSDVAVSADGSNVYLLTSDGDATPDMSMWRYASRWERVLSDQASDDDFIVRTAPDDVDVVYVADAGGTTIYYSTDAGQNKWHTRIFAESALGDLAVETNGSVVYASSTGGYVSKSTNSGFTWATKKSSKLSAGISMLSSLGEDLLLAGSTDGKAAYSKDGNTTWSKLADGMTSGTVQVIADGLDEGDLVCAVVAELDDEIYRWDWDDEEWDDIGDVPTDHRAYGIDLVGGVLYVVSSNGTYSDSIRSLNPTADDPDYNNMIAGTSTTTANFSSTPSALRISISDTTTKLWALDLSSGDYDLYSYKDTLAVAKPTLLSPREGFSNMINPISGTSFDITFSWVRPSKEVTAYDFQIALDSTFNEVALSQVLVDDSATVGVVAGPTGSTITTDAVPYTFTVEYMPEATYYWRVRVDTVTPATTAYGPIRSSWSDVRSFKIVSTPVTPPVTVSPTPQITVEVPPAPSITLPAPEIIIPTPEIVLPAPQVTLPPTPAPVAPIPGWALYAIIFIGAVLVIALIVLILRTRRPV